MTQDNGREAEYLRRYEETLGDEHVLCLAQGEGQKKGLLGDTII